MCWFLLMLMCARETDRERIVKATKLDLSDHPFLFLKIFTLHQPSTHMHTHTHALFHTNTFSPPCQNVWICMCVYEYICVCMCMCVCVCVQSACMLCLYICLCVCVCACMCVHQWRLVVFKTREEGLRAWLPLACLHC